MHSLSWTSWTSHLPTDLASVKTHDKMSELYRELNDGDFLANMGIQTRTKLVSMVKGMLDYEMDQI